MICEFINIWCLITLGFTFYSLYLNAIENQTISDSKLSKWIKNIHNKQKVNKVV